MPQGKMLRKLLQYVLFNPFTAAGQIRSAAAILRDCKRVTITADAKTRKRKTTGRPHAERRRESMTLILDHAEAEFAAKGYNGATLASVAARAGVDTALMRYYFGDKEQLFAAVFRRKGPEVNAARMAALDAYRPLLGNGGTLVGLIDAFVRGGFEMGCDREENRNYAAIVAYVNSSRGELHELMSEVFDEVSNVFIADLQVLLPNASKESLYWSYHFLTGAFTFSLGQTGRIDRISHGAVKSGDFAGIADRLPVFVAAGIEALCRYNDNPSRQTKHRAPKVRATESRGNRGRRVYHDSGICAEGTSTHEKGSCKHWDANS